MHCICGHVNKPAVCFLALGCELHVCYNTADRAMARAKARARSRSYAAMYIVYDAGFVRYVGKFLTLSKPQVSP